MKITQVYQLLNTVIGEVTGKTDLVAEDLSNVVDVGKEILGSDNMVDAYVKSLVNHIGKVIFVNRVYGGRAPSVLMNGWEYGSILEKIHADLPDSVENESWDLTAGQTYNQDIFNVINFLFSICNIMMYSFFIKGLRCVDYNVLRTFNSFKK